MYPAGSTRWGQVVRELNNMFIVYFSGHPVTVYPAGYTRLGQVVREPNNMFIVYFSGHPVTVYPAGYTRLGQVVREPNNMFIVYFSGHPVTVYPAGRTRWGQVVRETNNMFIVYFSDPVTVYPAGRTRWGQVLRWSGCVDVHAWCVGDMEEVIQAHTAAHPDHQETAVRMFISPDTHLPGALRPPYSDLWGYPADDSWFEEAWSSLLQAVPTTWGSEDAWTSLLQAVPTTWRSEWLYIYVPNTAPLRVLLACLPHSPLTQGRYIKVSGGTAGLGEVEACVYTCQQAGLRVRLQGTTILVPEGEEDSLRARRDRLCEATNRGGWKMLQYTKWRTQTG